MVSGLPIENGKPNVSADSPAVKAANYAWDHPYGGKSSCGAAVGSALDRFFKTKMKLQDTLLLGLVLKYLR